MAKLTDKQKERIKYLYNEQGYKVTLLADMFNTTRETIYCTIDDKYREKRKEHKRAYYRERQRKIRE